MTKLLAPKILLILLMSFFSTAAIAHDIEVKNADGVTVYYNWINDKTELQVSYRGDNCNNYRDRYSGNVVIPESVKYNGKTYSVTSIGEFAFCDCSSLTSITIPNSVTSIGDSAFSGCSSLTYIKVESGNIIYDSRENCNAIVETATNTLISGCKKTIIPSSVTSIRKFAFSGCSGLTSITFPNSVTKIGYEAFSGCTGLTSIELPSSIKRIDGNAFSGCSISTVTIPNSVTDIAKGSGESPFNHCNSLISIKVESGNTVYDSRNNCNAIIETATNELVAGCKTTIIPNSVTSIAYNSMCGFKDLTSITIPPSVTRIAFGAFQGCGLTSIIIPNSVTSIGNYAFGYCGGLTSIISKIQNPFVIEDNVFKYIYATATLTVPKGTKAAYQATAGWNKFDNIVEEGADEVMFTTDGVTYLESSSNKTAVVKSVDTKLKTLEIPASVSYNGTSYQLTGVADNAFSGCTMAALIWNADVALPSNAFSSASIGSNFLLYVKSESYAPSSVKNIIVNGTAQTITLSDDGGQFYCPQSFTARSISYTHNYSMETGGAGKGWETIALPFNVQKISHTTRGEIVPFASYNGGSNLKPFWLASMASGGFRSSSSIQANTPYIIAMPNNSSYRNDYILAGDVTFSSENVSVPMTPTFSGKFVPTYSSVSRYAGVYALNVVNKYVNNAGGYAAGSRFISNLRDVRPFEAYISQGSSTRGVIEIGFSDGTTGMAEVIGVFDADRSIGIYTLSGQKVAQGKLSELDVILNQLPQGVYIVNGKKIVK